MKHFIFICIYLFTIRSEAQLIFENIGISEDISDVGNDIGGFLDQGTTSDEIKIKQDSKQSNSWKCPKDDAEKYQDLILTNEMLKKGEMEIDSKLYKSENTILILGNAGVGKTTFVQFMSDDNSKLISKEVGEDTGQFLIEDGIKIGNSVTESFTLYPEQLIIDSNNSFTDTPGFSDTRSERHEAVATYVMKKYLKNIKNIKIVLMITYYSVEQGVYKDDFVDLLLSINKFIKNIDKYKNNIVLIATKVPNTYKFIKNKVVLIPDKKIVTNIADFLKQVKSSLQDRSLHSYKKYEKINFNNIIKIIESLEEVDEDGNYKKINILRRPSESGSLSTMSLFQEEKLSLQKTIFNNIEYTQVSNDDIGYTLSSKAIIYLNCLLWYINENVKSTSSYIYDEIKNHYENNLKNYVDTYELNAELDKIYNKLKTLKKNLKESNDYTNFSSNIYQFILKEKIEIHKLENETFLEVHDYINNLQQFADTEPILSPLSWAEQMKTILSNIKEKQSWNSYLIKLFEYLSSYDIQNNKTKYKNLIDFIDRKTDKLDVFLYNFETLAPKPIDTNLNLLRLDDERHSLIGSVLSFTLEDQSNITCHDGRLIIFGNFIKTSIITSDENMIKYCKNNSIKSISLFAVYTIFIDDDLNSEKFRGIDIFITAPRWEIIGRRIVSTDGIAGKFHDSYKAKDGENFGDDGEDGMPGFPGGNGGRFFGIGINFINDYNLVISSNGANGGPGQDGGHGKNGKKGKEGYDKDNLPMIDNHKEKWEEFFKDNLWKNKIFTTHKLVLPFCSTDIKTYTRDGQCGGNGGRGGNGGVGGFGGKAGKIKLVVENDNPKFSIQNLTGSPGIPGKGGNGGKPGEHGKAVTCFKIQMGQAATNCHPSYEDTFWKCKNLMYDNSKCTNDHIEDGLSNYITNGIQSIINERTTDFSDELNCYTLLLKNNQNNHMLKNKLEKLQNLINENIVGL